MEAVREDMREDINEKSEEIVNEGVNNFQCDSPGRNSFAVSAEGLHVGNRVRINDKDSDLSNFIVFGKGGYVKTIRLVKNTNPLSMFHYTIEVYGKGPEKGYGHLTFNDRTGDYYDLSIYRAKDKWHSVDLNSDNPQITAINWSDDGI